MPDAAAEAVETFQEFKDSFSYGSRNDLSFKFMKSLSPEDAAEFLRQALHEIGEVFDDPTTSRLIDLAYEWQVRGYTPQPGAERRYVYEDRPFRPPAKPLSETVVGLVASSGHFLADDPPPEVPADMTQEEAAAAVGEFMRRAPTLSEIGKDTPPEVLRVRQPGYDTRSAERDHNVTFPLQPLREAEAEGLIGALAPVAYSFVGVCSQGRLRKELDGWVERWLAAGAEALLLVPV